MIHLGEVFVVVAREGTITFCNAAPEVEASMTAPPAELDPKLRKIVAKACEGWSLLGQGGLVEMGIRKTAAESATVAIESFLGPLLGLSASQKDAFKQTLLNQSPAFQQGLPEDGSDVFLPTFPPNSSGGVGGLSKYKSMASFKRDADAEALASSFAQLTKDIGLTSDIKFEAGYSDARVQGALAMSVIADASSKCVQLNAEKKALLFNNAVPYLLNCYSRLEVLVTDYVGEDNPERKAMIKNAIDFMETNVKVGFELIGWGLIGWERHIYINK